MKAIVGNLVHVVMITGLEMNRVGDIVLDRPPIKMRMVTRVGIPIALRLTRLMALLDPVGVLLYIVQIFMLMCFHNGFKTPKNIAVHLIHGIFGFTIVSRFERFM